MTWSSEQRFPPPIVKVEVETWALGSDPRREPGVVGVSPAPVVSVMTFLCNNLKGSVFLAAQICRAQAGNSDVYSSVSRDGAVTFGYLFDFHISSILFW